MNQKVRVCPFATTYSETKHQRPQPQPRATSTREPNHKGRERNVNPDPAVTWQNRVRQSEELTRI